MSLQPYKLFFCIFSQSRKDVFVPIHLYGQLVQHKHGFQLLEKQSYLSSYFHCVRHQTLETDQQIVKLKAALWALVSVHFKATFYCNCEIYP